MKDLAELHLWDYLGVVIHRRHVALAVLLGCIALAALYTFTRVPKYRAVSRILIENQSVQLTDVEDALSRDRGRAADLEFLPTQLRLLTSRPVIEDALRRSGLLEKDEFREAVDPVAKLAGKITVNRERNARLAKVSVLRRDADEAARIVNAVVDAFKTQSRRRRLGISGEGLQELRRKSEELRQKLDGKTEQARAFINRNDIISFEHSRNVEAERHRALSESIARVEPVRLSLKARVEAAETALKNGAAIDALPDVLESRIIVELKLELARLGLEFADLRHRYGDQHPQIQGLELKMSSLRAQIGLIAQSILTSLKAQYQTAENEVRYLYEEIATQEEKLARYSELEYEYQLLLKDKQSTEQAYDQIIRRIEELDLSQMQGQGDNIFVISAAEPPREVSWPSHPRNLFLGAFAGLVFAVASCFFLEYMDTTVKTPADIREALQCEVIGSLPRIEGSPAERDLDLLENPRGPLAESIKMVRAALMFGRGEPPGAFVVTSTFPEEGKTLVTASLAISFAQSERRVLLVDADLRKPRMHEVFGLDSARGLSDLLQRIEPLDHLEQCIRSTRVPGLDFLPAGPVFEDPAERLNSSEFSDLVRRARERYDLVIFDSPPSLALVDAMIISKHLDGILPVVRTHSTQRKALTQFRDALSNAQVPVIGAIANNVDAPRAGGFSGRYGYDYGYGTYGNAPRPAAT